MPNEIEIEFYCQQCGEGIEVGEEIPHQYEERCYACDWPRLLNEKYLFDVED